MSPVCCWPITEEAWERASEFSPLAPIVYKHHLHPVQRSSPSILGLDAMPSALSEGTRGVRRLRCGINLLISSARFYASVFFHRNFLLVQLYRV